MRELLTLTSCEILQATELKKLNLVDNYQNHVRVFLELLSNKDLNRALASSPLFAVVPKSSPLMLEGGTVLGPLFRLGTIPSMRIDRLTNQANFARHPVGEACFFESKNRHRDMDIVVEQVRTNLKSHQASLVQIVKALIKDKDTQEQTFNWFSVAMSSNEKRKMVWFVENRHLEETLSSTGFVYNIASVLLSLCKPFMDPDCPLALKIDGTFLLSKHRMDLSKETRVVATDDEVTSWMDVRNLDRINQYRQAQASSAADASSAPDEPIIVSETFGTISEFFFLTLRAIHVLNPVLIAHDSNKMTYAWYQLLNQLSSGRFAPEQEPELMAQCNQKGELKYCFDVVTHDDQMLEDLVRFARLTMRWLLRLADAPATIVPLPTPPSNLFKAIPEYICFTVLDCVKYVATTRPPVLELMQLPILHDICNFLMAFASSQAHIKSPHLRGKIMECLSLLIPKGKDRGFEHDGGNLSTLFHDHTVLTTSLIPALVQFYIDIEVTGGHRRELLSQGLILYCLASCLPALISLHILTYLFAHAEFYDKHEYRGYMGALLIHVSDYPSYLDALVRESRDSQKFIRFVNMMLNDVVYYLDEGLINLPKIKACETARLDTAAWEVGPFAFVLAAPLLIWPAEPAKGIKPPGAL